MYHVLNILSSLQLVIMKMKNICTHLMSKAIRQDRWSGKTLTDNLGYDSVRQRSYLTQSFK